MDPLLVLTASALSGLASRPNGGHGVSPRTADELGAEAVAMAKGALAALEADAEPPKPAKRR